jgi:ectoine hydroxylase-related dioxygenase (phytanoyl-CoA dioxygenase family)
MQIGNWSATRELNDLYREIRELGIEGNLAELSAFGFTVIEGALSADLTTRLRTKIIAIAEDRLGRKLDIANEVDTQEINFIPYLLYKDPVFQEALLERRQLALITYLLGQHCQLSSLSCHLKGPGGAGLLLHSDTGNGVPAPFSPYSLVANCNFALTDYTEERGALAMVPGSHNLARHPTVSERGLDGNDRNPDAIPIEVPAGSAVVWHGNTWHGSFPRKIPGLRINLSTYYCRQFIVPQENYKDHVPAGYLDGNPDAARLGRLLGQETVHGWRDDGPSERFNERRGVAGRTWQA